MEQFTLESFEIMGSKNNTPNDWENFDLKIKINIKKNEESSYYFFLRIISLQWLKNNIDSKIDKQELGIYFKNTLILKYYDEQIISYEIQNWIRRCNLEKGEKSFNC
ncbi:Imm8 family immunity protein, partial [Candidatus Dependentiae bacterium]